ncbi:MAG: hypothetical protein V3U19_05635 [Thermodesulfobacteriota bacterium]
MSPIGIISFIQVRYFKAKAIEHYEKFLSLWKDADPGILEVEDAKKRVAVKWGQAPIPKNDSTI